MSEDPDRPATPASWLEKLNLPELIAGPAGKAISRLIGGVADIPAALFERGAQRIRDRTNQGTKVRDAVAAKVADRVSNDPDLIRRAEESLLAKEWRKQSNKEAVAEKTAMYLGDTMVDASKAASPDDDWMNVFEKFAEDASSDRLRETWAKVLSGQIRRPKSFSLRTLNFIAQLDERVASAFEQISSSVINGDFIYKKPGLESAEYQRHLLLQEYGILSGVDSVGGSSFTINANENIAYLSLFNNKKVLIVEAKPERATEINITIVTLTTVGQEIYSILSPLEDINAVKLFMDHCKGLDEIHRLSIADIVTGGETSEYRNATTLWTRVEPT